MPSRNRARTEPGQKADGFDCVRGSGWPTVATDHRAAEAGEAAWHHNEAFEDLDARVKFLGSRLADTRTQFPDEQKVALESIAEALGDLEESIARARATWSGDSSWLDNTGAVSPVPDSRAPAPPPQQVDPADPWDPETAELLTRVCEIAAFEEQTGTMPRRSSHMPPQPSYTGSIGPQPQGVEVRLAALADQLQRSLPHLDPAQWLAPTEDRLHRLEAQLAFNENSGPSGPQKLDAIESQIRDVARSLEAAQGELRRLDAIEDGLRALMSQLKRESALPAQAESTLVALAEQAAERAAEKLAGAFATLSSPAADNDQVAALEALLRSHSIERRQDARTAVGVLRSVQQSVALVAERLQSLQPSLDTADARDDAPHDDRDLLMKAYAEGARALGHVTAAPVHARAGRPQIHPGWRATIEDRRVEPESGAESLEHLRASALRARLKAQSTPGILVADEGEDASGWRPEQSETERSAGSGA